ncbi:ATP-dependent DNA helicase sgs1 [Puccinia graminis f. sp. tritici]|uniref:DNA 3'-5' helicase n=1 Tax=Puccinia graminis f. sp. tritici TaxID=56615 RepID=A0A5B0SE01_PUCGR|nr:ATP-dependent DNA helicase sgs1 [Puccinia graminis f. sp. tritici]KAA1136012.1 ATP-dependent DNA helicase sgs1 [Puccinia graminis f. sp. tritici]
MIKPKKSIPVSVHRKLATGGTTVLKKLLEKNDEALKTEIASRAKTFYNGEDAKLLQVKTVASLARGKNTFLLAGTGFGKSRIPEMYHMILPPKSKSVILVLNPLDALGDNQVEEKKGKFTAINLTKMMFTPVVAKEIMEGVYNFVYLSPEIFLNSKLWDSVYFSSEFQKRLGLVVVDEAHMIYIWGLVESSNGTKKYSILVRHQDIGIFRPSYGDLARHLQCRNNVPILLLSATCRPIAVDSILKSLKLTMNLITMIHGELTRSEIRIIRINMTSSLKSNLDLLNVFPSAEQTASDHLVPTLIYSGTRARTLTVLEVLDIARGTPRGCRNAKNMLARRFHSTTGDKDKSDCIQDFSEGRFPIISATMALGLGQNWKRVRSVIHMGRGDPANICQMIGRCGRDGKGGLAILFVESNRKGGKNCIDDFHNVGDQQSDQDRMDALAVTPVCLRVALYDMDNKHGYIPLSKEDPNYIKEVQRQEDKGLPKCRCSNCMVEKGVTLSKNLRNLNRDNFDDALMDAVQFPESVNVPKPKNSRSAVKESLIDNAELAATFKAHLMGTFTDFYEQRMSTSARFVAAELFQDHHALAVVHNLPNILNTDDLNDIIGGETVSGQLELLWNVITNFRSDPLYHEHMENQKKSRLEAEELKKQKKREYGVRYRANKRAQLAAENQQQGHEIQQLLAGGSHGDIQNIPSAVQLGATVELHQMNAEMETNEADEIRKRKKREYAVRYRANKRARLLAEKEAARFNETAEDQSTK